MPEHELEKLLGGFAADTLTEEERKILYTAALQDQQLFNAMADEQALKELLTDPVVRHRLLQALQKTSPSGAGGLLSWLDWFRRPAGLAFAGGLASAALAVVLGTKIYQDSLKQAVRSVATEEAKPAAPPATAPPVSQPTPPSTAESQPQAKMNEVPAKAAVKKDALLDKMTKRERAVSPSPQEPKASDSVAYADKGRKEQDEGRRQADAPVAEPGKAVEGASASADQKPAASSAPPTSVPIPPPMQAPAGAAATGATAPTVSARTLFYGEVVARPESGMMAQEKERAMKPLAESAPQANKPERRFDQFSQLGRAKGAITSVKPLGLRYSFVVRGTDGQEREADAATVSRSGGHVHLTVEVNQDAYLQIFETVGSSIPQLLFPDKSSGQTSLTIAAGQRQYIALPTESGPTTLTARLSRAPIGPITRQEAAMPDRRSSRQVQESITAGGTDASQEQATYVVNQDPSSAQLSVTIPLNAP